MKRRETGLCMTYIDDVFGYGRKQEKDSSGRLLPRSDSNTLTRSVLNICVREVILE